MKNFLVILALVVGGAAAHADVYVPYGQWVSLPHCGGQTRLLCNGPRQNNQCNIEFTNSYSCNTIKLYVGWDYRPTSDTYESSMQGSFYVDNNKIGWYTDSFRVYMDKDNQGSSGPYERIVYQFNY